MSLDLRWDPYYLAVGRQDIESFWKAVQSSQSDRVLYVLGRGFDPRATIGVDILLSSPFLGSCDCLSIEMVGLGHQGSPALETLSDSNFQQLKALMHGHGQLHEERIDTWVGDQDARERAGPDKALRLIDAKRLDGYLHIVLDISALPRGLYFPLISRLIDLCAGIGNNLHVFVGEDPGLDGRIEESGLEEDAYFVPPFRSDMEIESDSPIIWMPLLGEKQNAQVGMVQSLVSRYSPDLEVCPVLPLPARNPRRADGLIRQYSEYLASGWENDARNFVYVSEHNPFQTYRHLVNSAQQYNDALKPIGGCRTVISAHSSKLLSVGALLAAYQLRAQGMCVGLANVDATSYTIRPAVEKTFLKSNVVPHLLSLTGTAYET